MKSQSIPRQCSVIRFHKIGGLEVLQHDKITLTPPKGDEVLFRVKAFALNQADILFIHGNHYTLPNFPSRIGSEATGEVVAVGSEVSGFSIGDEVTSIPFYTQQYGVQGEYATVPEKYLTKVPQHYTTEEATSFWMQYLTAYYALFKLGKVEKDDIVFIPATSGTAGQGALKVAKDAGAIVIGSTRAPQKKDFIAQLGADHVIVTTEEPLSQRLDEISGKQGIKFVFDPIGGKFVTQYIGALSLGGSIALYGLLSGEETIFPILELLRRNATFYAYSMFNYVRDTSLLEEGKQYILKRIEQNVLRPHVDKVFSFDDTVEAYRYMLSNQQKGKIVVKV